MAKVKMTYEEAINKSIYQEMERDDSVFIYGIGVPDHKKIFGTTKRLFERFGKNRCMDTPLAEDGLTGFALGAAVNGLRPILTHIRVDFALLSINQLFNNIASYRYMSGGQLNTPIVIRVVIGRGWGQGAQHSKSLQSMFAHIPGLKVIMPTTPNDVKGMMAAAIRDENPVVVIEHRWLYWQEGEVEEDPFVLPLDKANILREGNDLTVVSTSWMNVEALKAAEVLKRKANIDLEIIDHSCISSIDITPISKSVQKTKKCIIVDNDWVHCGFSAELAAQIYDVSSDHLDCAIERIGFAPTPCPTVRHLENEFYPNAVKIIKVVERMLGIPPISMDGEEFYSHEKKFKGPF
jgi:acetoin:2,6-dichlorophenolindophenol oxidoreductase subunit beta